MDVVGGEDDGTKVGYSGWILGVAVGMSAIFEIILMVCGLNEV